MKQSNEEQSKAKQCKASNAAKQSKALQSKAKASPKDRVPFGTEIDFSMGSPTGRRGIQGEEGIRRRGGGSAIN